MAWQRWAWCGVILLIFLSHPLTGILLGIATAFYWLYDQHKEREHKEREQRREDLQREQDQKEFDAFFQEWRQPHHDDEIRLKVWAAKLGLTYEEATEKAWDHWCFIVNDPWHATRKESEAKVKRLPEAVASAQKMGVVVQLGNPEFYRSPARYSEVPGRRYIEWGECHLPAVKVTKDGVTHYYFPGDFVDAVDKGVWAVDESKYPFNEPGQKQLQELFVNGKPKDEADEAIESSDKLLREIENSKQTPRK